MAKGNLDTKNASMTDMFSLLESLQSQLNNQQAQMTTLVNTLSNSDLRNTNTRTTDISENKSEDVNGIEGLKSQNTFDHGLISLNKKERFDTNAKYGDYAFAQMVRHNEQLFQATMRHVENCISGTNSCNAQERIVKYCQ